MLSNKPSPNSITSEERSAFHERNAEMLRKLAAFLTISEGLTIGFVNSPGLIENNLLLDFLDREVATDVDLILVDVTAPDLRFLLDAIVSCLESFAGNHNKPKVVVVSGLERSIGVLGDYPPVLADLNFARDAYRKRVPYPLLFILPSYAITRVARFAPDFWAWKSVEFSIHSTYALPITNNVGIVPTVQVQQSISLECSISSISLPITNNVGIVPTVQQSIPVRQERFDLLNRLLREEYTEDSLTRADLFLQRSKAYFSHGQYTLSKADAIAALELYQVFQRPLSVAESCDLLSEIAYGLATHQEGITFAKKAIAIREEQLGANHPDTAKSLNNLAELYWAMGRYTEAEPLYKRSLAIREKQLGAEHPDTAASLNNLAGLYYSMGRYVEAEPLYKRSLAIREKHLGAEHPDTSTSLNNLASLYEVMGRYTEAEPLYERAMAIREKQLGAEHPDTAISLNNLASLYESMGRYAAAEPLYERAMAIREKQLGAEHPSTATSLNNLASLYESMGRYTEAETLYERSLAIYEKRLGANHPSTTITLNNLIKLYRAMGKNSEAEQLLASRNQT